MTTAKATSKAISRIDPIVRFWRKVEKHKSGCWVWRGAESANRGRTGYGHFYDGQKMCSAHRFSYSLSCGPLSQSDQLHHTCKNTLCVNPAHLIVTNLGDTVAREVTSYRLQAGVREVVQIMADMEQVTLSDIIEEAIWLLAKKKKVEGAK